jgi:hypothetical protein
MKQLFIDYSKWRCGGDSGPNKLGKDETALLNDKGYMCCLGQFSLQLGCDRQEILNEGQPRHINVNREMPLLITTKKDNTLFSDKAMRINDDEKQRLKKRL